jgi:aldehyde dehydrogenase (NAD+)
MQEEIFGPILPVLTWDKIDDVLNFINDRPKPLALYYFGSNKANQNRIENETSSGAFSVNDAIFHLLNPHLPFGGVGNSGMGAYHGEFGFNSCSHLKPIFIKATLNLFPLSARYPPYTDFKQSVMNFLLSYTSIEQSKALKAISYTAVLATSIILYKKGKLDRII